ncbi:MAG: flagellar motor switch protein FliG [Treponema sp.]|jgi:flagellar motor switch protein FliG|nr:flagellar motor switch protein FliG [Treponema sp.]
MGKSKSPEPSPAGPGNEKLNRALSAYKTVLKQKNPAPGERAGEGAVLIKTGAPVPAEPPGLRKALFGGEEGGPAARPAGKTGPEARCSKYRRVAQFLVLVGSGEASRILAGLEPEQLEAVSREIAALGRIDSREREAVLEEFRSLLQAPYGYSGSGAGGIDPARQILYAAFGPEKGEALLLKAVPGAAENPFDFLKDFTGDQLGFLLKDESPAAAALVLSRLPAKLTAAFLAGTGPEKKLVILRRIAHMGESPPEVLEQAAAALREKARHIGRVETTEVDGMGALTEILKCSDLSFGDRLLEQLGEEDPALSRTIKDRLYTLDDVVKAEDRAVQERLREMPDRDIALLLRNRSGEFTAKILSNLSRGREERVREEGEILGPVPRIEAEAAAREFLAWFRLGREEGRIIMMDDDDIVK